MIFSFVSVVSARCDHGVIVITAAALAQDVVGVAIANFGDAAVGASIPVVTCPFRISRQC